MKFSLIVATISRVDELERLFQSLGAQAHRDFELIVVDQNRDDRLEPILLRHRGLCPVIHLRSKPGLSLARNLGLAHASGDIVAFPDDDCWYPSELLRELAGFFASNPEFAGITGRCVTESLDHAFVKSRVAGRISPFDAHERGTSVTMFFRREAINTIGEFDETLGLGPNVRWVGSEDYDYLLRAVKAGLNIYYDPEIAVFHKSPETAFDQARIRRAYAYALGAGHVLRKNRMPARFVHRLNFRSLAGAALYAVRGDYPRARFYWNVLKGRLTGWRGEDASAAPPLAGGNETEAVTT